MNWNQVIEATRVFNEERAELVNAAVIIRDRYHAFMTSMQNHLLYPGYLELTAEKLKFMPEKSSMNKGFLFANSKVKCLVPPDYLADPDQWEANFQREIDERYALIRANCSAHFFEGLGDLQTQERTEVGVTAIIFRSQRVRENSRYRIESPWYYLDKATGNIYQNTNGTYALFRAIAAGTATPANL